MSQPLKGTPPRDRVSRDAGRYLLELYFISLDADDPVRTGELSNRLDVHPASVTEMVSKLDSSGLVKYEKHDGTTLSEPGESLAERLAWRYCVTDRFFTEIVDASVDKSTIYRIGFELPTDGVATLGRVVDIPCIRACSRLDRQCHTPNSQATRA